MAAFTLGLAMNLERMPVGGCAEQHKHCSGESCVCTPGWGWGALAALGIRRKAAPEAQGTSVVSLTLE